MSINGNQDRRRASLLQDLGITIFAGLIFGVLYLWIQAYPHGGFWASWAAGTVLALVFLLAARRFGPLQGPKALAIGAVAGALGGFIWWVIARPTLHLAFAVAIGAVYVPLLVIFEGGGGHRRR